MLTINATPKEIAQLKRYSRTHDKAYLREKAGALVKIAQGHNATWVARHGLNTSRTPKTVRSWVHIYKEQGFEGLQVSPGRGRKPAFFPSVSRRY